MQYKKLSREQKAIKWGREKRNRLVCKLLDENPKMLRSEALIEANRIMRERAAGRR